MMHSDSVFGSSRVLKSGEGTVDGWHHYLGMSVDGFDGTGVWMINGYGGPSEAVGLRVREGARQTGSRPGSAQGLPRSRLPWAEIVQARPVRRQPRRRQRARDDHAPDLTRHGSPDIPIKTFQVKAIAHGAQHERTVNFQVPPTPADSPATRSRSNSTPSTRSTSTTRPTTRPPFPCPDPEAQCTSLARVPAVFGKVAVGR